MLDSGAKPSAIAISAKLAGMFKSPCGAWVAPYRMRSGAVWFRPLPAATRNGVLTSERSA